MGMKLYSTFIDAGLPAPHMRLEAIIGGGAHGLAPLRMYADVISSFSVEIERLGIATADEIDIETLFDRMSTEAVALGSVIVRHSEIGAWTAV